MNKINIKKLNVKLDLNNIFLYCLCLFSCMNFLLVNSFLMKFGNMDFP